MPYPDCPPPSPLPQGGKLHGMDAATYLSWRRFHLSKAKLNNVAEMASFMAGFAVVATVELQINPDTESDSILLIAFAVTTALLVATSMLTVMISTCILPELNAISKISKCPSPDISRSPHDALTYFVNLSWILANTVSLFLFTLDIIFIAWIQFAYFSEVACWAATCIMVPILIIIIIFGIVFYRELNQHRYDLYTRRFQEIAKIQATLEMTDSDFLNSTSPDRLPYQSTITSASSAIYDSGIEFTVPNSNTSSVMHV